MAPRFQRLFALAGVLFAGLIFLVACGGGGGKGTETPKASPAATQPAGTQPSGAETPGAQTVPGVTDTEILLGTHFPLSETPAAAYAPAADAIRAYFDYINSQGGIYGRKIRFEVGDDHFNPSDAIEVVRRLVEQDKVFAILSGLGDLTHAAVYKYLQDNGVPDMYIGGGLVVFTDPVAKNRFGGNPDYDTEGRMLGKYIAENFNGKKLALLLENDAFGQNGKDGILKGLEGSNVQIVAQETYETTQWDVTAQTQRLKNANPDVVAVYAIPPPAASLVKTARETLNWNVPIVVTGVVATDIFIQLAGPQNAEGVVSVVFAHQVYETDNPGIQRHLQIMRDFGKGLQPSNLTVYGQGIAELMVKSLENAGPNLTRESLEDGAEAIRDFCCSFCTVPVNLSPTDHRPFEMEYYVRVGGGKWVQFGEPVNFESTPGKLTTCGSASVPAP